MVHDNCGTFLFWHHASSQGAAKACHPPGIYFGHRDMQCGDRDEASSSDGGDGRRARVGSAGVNKSRFRGVSFDKKKRKWRVQIKVSACDGVRNPQGWLQYAVVVPLLVSPGVQCSTARGKQVSCLACKHWPWNVPHALRVLVVWLFSVRHVPAWSAPHKTDS